MKKILAVLSLAVSMAHGQILAPILMTHPSTSSFSQIRCTAIQTYSGTSSYVINFPSCKTAGDLVVIVIGAQGTISTGNVPSDWSWAGGDSSDTALFWNTGAFAKILTSADVSAGSVTFPTVASNNGTTTIIEFNGTTGGFTVGDVTTADGGGTAATANVSTPIALVSDDTILWFGSYSGTVAPTINRGTLLQSATANSGTTAVAAALYSQHVTSPQSALTATVSYSTYGASSQGRGEVAIVVHGGSWTPRSIPGLQAWYGADCITMTGIVCNVPSNGTNPTAWYNRAIYATSTVNGGSNCTFNTSQVNGNPAVTFVAAGHCTVTLNMPPYTSNSDSVNKNVSFAGVWANTSTAAKGTLFGGAAWAYAYWTCNTSIQQGMDAQGHTQLGTGTAACDTSFHQANAVFTYGASISFRIGEATDTTQSPSLSPSGAPIYPTVIGFDSLNSNEYFGGKIAEVMFYAHALQSSEITLLESYFHTKYGL